MSTKNVFSSFHCGDQLFMLMFLNIAAKRTTDEFVFSVRPEYVDQVRGMARKLPNLIITDKHVDGSFDGWIGRDNWYQTRRNPSKFLDFLIEFHGYIAKLLGLSWATPSHKEMLFPAESMDPNHPLSGQSFDMLFVNSTPLSGQCHGFSQGLVDELVRRFAGKFKLVATHPCGDDRIPVTTQLGLKLNQIGELASRCKFVVGVANAPFLATFNELAFPHVKRWVNYSHDLVNFDDRVVLVNGVDQLERELNNLND